MKGLPPIFLDMHTQLVMSHERSHTVHRPASKSELKQLQTGMKIHVPFFIKSNAISLIIMDSVVDETFSHFISLHFYSRNQIIAICRFE